MPRHPLHSPVLLLGLGLLASGCADQPDGHHPTSETPITASIAVGGLNFDRVVIDQNSPFDPWMKNIGRIDTDALPDLIVSGANGPLVWYQAPNWTKRTISSNVSSESGSDVGDIDGDGDVDVVVGKTWFENVNAGASWVAHPLPVGSGSTHDIIVADVNGDGRLDITMRGQSASVVTVYQQNTPTSWTVYDVQPGIGLNGLDVADVNGDGRPDIVVGGIWMENPGGNPATGTWASHTFAPNWNTYASVKVIDMDGDGRRDIVLSVSEAQGKLSWFKAPADPVNGTWQENVIDTGLNKVHCFAVIDMNGDGLLDVAASEFEGEGRLILYLRNSNGTGFSSYVLGRDALHNMRAGDIDNDGDIDLFGAYCFGVAPVILYRNTGNSGGGSSAPPTVAAGAAASPSPATGTTTAVSALGADDGGEPALRYTWATTGSPPGGVSFSPNGSNTARSSVATFTSAGSYTLQVTITDAQNQSVLSSVTLSVTQTSTSMVVTPASASVSPGSIQAFAASSRDQFNQPMTAQPSLSWTVSGGGSITSGGSFVAGASAGGPFTVTATGGGRSGTASVTVTSGSSGSSTFGESAILGTADGNNGNLLVAQQASLAQAGTLQSLSFYVAGAAGQLRLGVYTATGPGGGPGTKVAETAAVTPVVGWNTVSVVTPVGLSAGTYWLAYLPSSNSLQFRHATTGAGRWYAFTFGALPSTFSTSPSSGAYHWSFYGTLDAGGGSPPNQAPTIATAAGASPATVTGSSTALTVLGADDAGEAALRYTWSTTGAPPAAVTFAANGSNAAKATTASFTRAGSYALQVTIADAPGLSVTSSVTVTVNQNLTSVVVTPASSSVAPGGSTTFGATARDQFGQTLSAAPTFSWSVSGGGTISSSGQFTASGTAGGPYIVTATSGTTSGTASITVTSGAAITMGESALLPENDGNNKGLLVAQQTSLSQGATLQTLSFYVTQASGKLRLGLYGANGPSGGPGTKLAETAEFTPVTGWNTVAVSTPVVLAPGTYWLAYLSNTNSLRFRMSPTGNGRWKAVTYGAMPTTYPNQPLSGAYHWSFYATLQ